MQAHEAHADKVLRQCTSVHRRPDLLGAGIARSPFLDLLDTISDPEAYLTTHEYAEWGNPTSSPQALDQVRTHAAQFLVPAVVPCVAFRHSCLVDHVARVQQSGLATL